METVTARNHHNFTGTAYHGFFIWSQRSPCVQKVLEMFSGNVSSFAASHGWLTGRTSRPALQWQRFLLYLTGWACRIVYTYTRLPTAGFQSGPMSSMSSMTLWHHCERSRMSMMRVCRESFRWADLASDSKPPLVRVSGYAKSHILRDKTHSKHTANTKIRTFTEFNCWSKYFWHHCWHWATGPTDSNRFSSHIKIWCIFQGILWYSD